MPQEGFVQVYRLDKVPGGQTVLNSDGPGASVDERLQFFMSEGLLRQVLSQYDHALNQVSVSVFSDFTPNKCCTYILHEPDRGLL